MNRIVLIGNGFDMAHDLKTSYANLLDLYIKPYLSNHQTEASEIENTEFFTNIIKHVEIKNWVDIENEYYQLLIKYALEENDESKVKRLNKQLHFLQDRLVEYLNEVNKIEVKPIKSIELAIYSPLLPQDISISGLYALKEHIEGNVALSYKELEQKLALYGYSDFSEISDKIRKYKEQHQGVSRILEKTVTNVKNSLGYLKKTPIVDPFCPIQFLYPNYLMLLNFNYTSTAELYFRPKEFVKIRNSSPIIINQIHGELARPESVIFGYGDEMDEKYKELVNKNDNLCLGNIKSIRYLEEDNYHRLLNFIEYEPYQICIMGHSCGNSDRTLLNTLFEHRNCVSVKPYYRKKEDGTDNYLDIVQNISRNFNDMKLMRDRVVNKLFCRPFSVPIDSLFKEYLSPY